VFLSNTNVFQPDIVFVANNNLPIINWNKGIAGSPDLVIEVLLKGNRKTDLTEKKLVYEQSGVKEYWVIDPETKWCEGFKLTYEKYTSVGEGT